MKLMVRTIFRNVGILLLLPLNIFVIAAILLTKNASPVSFLGNGLYFFAMPGANMFAGTCLMFLFPVTGIICLFISAILWLRRRVQVTNE